MNHYCCVPRCSSWIKRDPQLIFHILPEGKHQVSLVNTFGQKERIDRRKAWILKLSTGKPVTKDLKKAEDSEKKCSRCLRQSPRKMIKGVVSNQKGVGFEG
ncbi:hypothetical protein NQ318_013425 [Aromia moschata]|uniref:THAP-type domain-containing protein n=1 Tax=Aromia moschata TaxID=1265417 RepID=A0AAV8YQ42_9CUCU|nr:hypothetical protein NQ318_013425 [Aromia moschata]